MPKQKLKSLFDKKLLIVLLMGFSSGLPFLLTGGTLKAWLARENVDIGTIGFFSWVGLAYSLKFIWSPFLDQFTISRLGRRRGWMILTQLLLMSLIFVLGSLDPSHDLKLMAIVSVLVALFSSTQDIAVDAYRREFLSFEQLGIGASFNMYGYRIAMLLSGGIGIGLVGSDFFSLTWQQLYTLIGCCMLVGIVTTIIAPEPEIEDSEKRTLRSALVEPFVELFKRHGSLFILFFVFLYKLGDALGGSLLNPYYIEMGFSNADIGLIAKTFGMLSSLLGLFIGGLAIYRFGIFRCLWIFGILQGLSTAAFALLTTTGPQPWSLGVVVIFEDITAGLGSSAFIAYISALTNKKFTATQYAILSSIATLGRNFFSGFSGYMVKELGWGPFYITCGLIAIPGILMLFIINKFKIFQEAQNEY